MTAVSPEMRSDATAAVVPLLEGVRAASAAFPPAPPSAPPLWIRSAVERAKLDEATRQTMERFHDHLLNLRLDEAKPLVREMAPDQRDAAANAIELLLSFTRFGCNTRPAYSYGFLTTDHSTQLLYSYCYRAQIKLYASNDYACWIRTFSDQQECAEATETLRSIGFRTDAYWRDVVYEALKNMQTETLREAIEDLPNCYFRTSLEGTLALQTRLQPAPPHLAQGAWTTLNVPNASYLTADPNSWTRWALVLPCPDRLLYLPGLTTIEAQRAIHEFQWKMNRICANPEVLQATSCTLL